MPSTLAAAMAAACPRILIISAHPDDETVGAAALMRGLLTAGASLAVARLTDGARTDGADARAHGFASPAAYARARRDELRRAMSLLPARPEQFALGFDDQQLVMHLVDVTNAVARLIALWRPRLVLTHPYEGGHPDHDATSLAVSVAAGLVRDTPEVIEFTSYHLDASGMRTGVFLGDDTQWHVTLPLDAEAARCKRAMLDAYVTQRETLRPFDAAAPERFRRAPQYDFRRPPHTPPLFYDHFSWGSTSVDWVRRASALLDALPGITRSCR